MSNSYTTTQGEAWDMIAYKKYDSEMQMPSIVELNPQEADAVFLAGEQKITLPASVNVEVKKSLPPWKKL